MALFAGLDRAHGRFAENGAVSAPDLSPITKTVLSPPTEELWQQHIDGTCGLGIIPINDDDNCVWGSIAVDDSTITPEDLEERVRKAGLPLLVARRYDGRGADCFLFLSEPTPARLLQERLREWAAVLGVGGSPVLPKQVSLAVTSDGMPQDVGSWHMMPYFGIGTGDTASYFIDNGMGQMLPDFINLAMIRRITARQLYEISPLSHDDLQEGPPCLRILANQGIAGDARKKVLRNIGVYCKLRYDDWEAKLEELNYSLMNPPLLSDDIQDIKKGLKRRGITYTCTERPLESFCNRSSCLKCKYGVGDLAGSDVEISGLTMIKTVPRVWYIGIDGVRMQLETKDLTNQTRFRDKCVDTVGKYPVERKKNDWAKLVTELLEQRTEIEAPEDAGPEGLFWSHVHRYCTVRPKSKTRDGLLEIGAVYEEDGWLYFRSPGLKAHLDRNHFRDFGENKVWDTLRKGGARHDQWNIQGHCIQWWAIPAFDEPAGDRPLPPLEDKEEPF